MLKLELLGPPAMTVDEAPVVVDTRKATALLAYLAVSGQPHRRDALAGLFWPDADTSRAGGALRRTLSALRTAIGASRITADRSSIGLLLDDVVVDVDETKRLMASCAEHGHPATQTCEKCVEPLAAVAALHRGRFLEGFSLRDSPGFDDWQFFTAEELSRDLAAVLERLAAALVRTGRLAEAITAARRRLSLDPLHEPAHRELIRLYAWNDEQSAALRQYRECVRVLDRELGVTPLPETTQLYEDVLEHRLQAPEVDAIAASVSPPRISASPTAAPAQALTPFVGREEAQNRLRAAVEQQGEDGVVVLLEGEAGIGKSRLVAETLATYADGRNLLVARSYQGEAGLAYGVIVEALRTALDQAGDEWVGALPTAIASEVSRLVPELVARRPEIPPPPSLDAPGARTRFVDALGRGVASAGEGDRPGVLVFEDLQWADDASLEVLVHLARRITGRRLVLVFTWRTELVDRAHALHRLAADVRRDGALVSVALQRLDEQSVTEALTAFGLTDETLAARVCQETEGLPLLVVEYARALLEDPTALEGPLPGGARDVLLSRLDGVGSAAAQVLATAAVIGRSFELDVLTEASGRTEDEVAGAIDELLARRLVAEIADAGHGLGAYDFTHAQLRRLTYDNATLARRRLLHRRVAAALESRTRRRAGDAIAGVIAGHWAAAGEDAEAASWEARAGAHAASLLAGAEAINHFRTALALGHPDVARIHERLGDLWTLQGRYTEAVASYESAAASAELDAAARLEHKLGVVLHRSGRLDLAERHLERALSAAGSQASPLRGRIIADRGINAYRRGDAAGAQALAEQAAAEAADAEDQANLAQAENLLGLLARARGDLSAAQQHLQRSLTLARELGDAAAETSALNNLALAVGAAGDTAEALRLAGAALERSAAVGDRHREAALHNNIADLLRSRGDTDEAMDHLKQAVAIFAEVGEPGVLTPEIWQLVDW